MNLLTRRERLQAVLILLFMLPNALMQVAGIASIMPFIAVLAQPSLVEQNQILQAIYQLAGDPPLPQFLAMLAGIALILLVLSNAIAATNTWLILRFSFMRTHSLSQRLLNTYLQRDYEFFLNRNASDLTKNVINEVNQLVSGFLMPMLQMAAHGVIVLAILVMLVLVNPMLAIIVGLSLGGAYSAIYIFFRGAIRKLGQRRLSANARRFKTTHEAFGAFKDLKVTGREEYYLRSYAAASYDFAKNQSNHQVITQMPRYALEALAFGVILLIALYLITSDPSSQTALPVIALYAMAGYRLMPSLQTLFTHVSSIRFAAPVVERISREMSSSETAPQKCTKTSGMRTTEVPETLRLNHSLTINNVTYRYPGMNTPVLDEITLSIPARTTVAFVGESGAGKSTLVDIILGLLKPESGSIHVDNIVLDESTFSLWRKHLGYVPQAIYLSDDTLRRNIALGIPDKEIDNEAVIAAAKAASIHDFITTELPEGYDTVAGDRGIRLSGGQRQRIGIARALYSNPDLLILDEATSALDGSTEAEVMDAIHRLSGHKTIIMIAHRLSTVRACDQIYLFSKGKLLAKGTYDKLSRENPEFRRMASPANKNNSGPDQDGVMHNGRRVSSHE